MVQLQLDDGGQLYYETVGSGPHVLLVPGLGGQAEFWAQVVPALAGRYTVILHDHRGTGRSSIERIAYSIDQMSSDVLALMDHLGVERAHFVGHSTGGAIGQALAIDRPHRIDRLVLSATWAAADPYFHHLFNLRADILRLGGPAAYLRASALVLNPPWWIRDHPELAEVTKESAASRIPDAEVVLARIAAILRHDRTADLHRISAPTLVIGARDDMVTPAYFSEDLGRRIGTSELIILPDGGHMFPITRSAAFSASVLKFFSPAPAV